MMINRILVTIATYITMYDDRQDIGYHSNIHINV